MACWSKEGLGGAGAVGGRLGGVFVQQEAQVVDLALHAGQHALGDFRRVGQVQIGEGIGGFPAAGTGDGGGDAAGVAALAREGDGVQVVALGGVIFQHRHSVLACAGRGGRPGRGGGRDRCVVAGGLRVHLPEHRTRTGSGRRE